MVRVEQAGRKVNMASPATFNQDLTTAHDTTARRGPSTLIPKKSDVLLGRGRGSDIHTGNLRYKGKHERRCYWTLEYILIEREPCQLCEQLRKALICESCNTALISSVYEIYATASKKDKMLISTYVVDRILENGRFLKKVRPNQWTVVSKRAARIKVAHCLQYHKRKLRALSASTSSRLIADDDNNDNDDDLADFVALSMFADEESNEEDLYHVDQVGADRDHDFPVRSDLLGPVSFQTSQGCYKVNGESGGTGVKVSVKEMLDKEINLAVEAAQNELITGKAWTKANDHCWSCDSECSFPSSSYAALM